MTDKQAAIYAGLLEYGEKHPRQPFPTVRELADFMEKKTPGSERFSDDEARGQLESLIDIGYSGKFRDKAENVRYRPVAAQATA